MAVCDECNRIVEDLSDIYEGEDGYRQCGKCAWQEYLQQEEDRRDDPENYCVSCGRYSEILDRQKCPMCFEGDGYT
jgi:hypothetical protein